MTATLDRAAAELADIVGADYVDASKTGRYARARVPAPFPVHRLRERLPDLVVMPSNTAEVVAVVELANELRIPLVPRDGGTGLTDGAVPVRGGIVVDV